MFFLLAKILGFLIHPASLILLFLLAGIFLGFTRWRALSRLFLLLAVATLVLGAFTNLGAVLIQPLESRFARPSVEPADVTGIIVLGGGMDADINKARGGYELSRAGDRFVEALRLAQLHPAARIVITGGLGDLEQSGEPEAIAGARFFAAMGIASDRLLLESASRNTEENAQLTTALVAPKAGEVWLLVTSAFHMPRTVGLFRKAGFGVLPWPTDYLASGSESLAFTLRQPLDNLSILTTAIREWSGLLAYHLAGKIDELVPGPK